MDHTIDYANDKSGRVTAVSGAAYGSHSNGSYAENIQYRAFGQIKQIDYKLPSSNTSAIRMEYDNRMRVSHFEASTPGSTTAFTMKANFTYYADGRTSGKDDQVGGKWSRTMNYDHAGRLKENVFGNIYESPYSQTISYTGFSELSERVGNYWGQDVAFSSIS